MHLYMYALLPTPTPACTCTFKIRQEINDAMMRLLIGRLVLETLCTFCGQLTLQGLIWCDP